MKIKTRVEFKKFSCPSQIMSLTFLNFIESRKNYVTSQTEIFTIPDRTLSNNVESRN